jgi:2-C-methyl-D-erythritol 2,4-cyclodiphosphate synthase
MELLGRIRAMVSERGASVVNVDATLILEAPRIAPHAEAMRANLARALGIEEDRVSVKATTNERLGALGREEGIAAMAVALLEVNER